jgi:serine/threonine-protein kinase
MFLLPFGKSRARFGQYYVTRLVHSGDKSFVFEAGRVAEAPSVAVKLYTKSYDRRAAELERKYGLPSEAELGRIINPADAEGAQRSPVVATLGGGREYGRRRGTRYIVQEFVPGVCLKHLIACRDRSVVERCGSLVLQMCRALRQVHRKGYVFRDFCPDNLIVGPGGKLKLIDLGFVAPAGMAFEERSGSPSYMSPEQIRGEPLGAESDVYALGAVLFELLEGRPPYISRIPARDESAARRLRAEVMQMHLKAPIPPLSDPVKQRAGALGRLVPRCMAKRPEERFSSADELIAELV